jgi:hypothetical protein
MNNNTLIMCNRRTISQTIAGPATDALERSLKRPRTEKTDKIPTVETAFYFPDLYNDLVATIDGGVEAFPSISWNFDDDSDNDDFSQTSNAHLHPSTESFMRCTKLVSNSLQRSKSFRTNLADLNKRQPVFHQRQIFESNVEPIRILDEDEGAKFFSCVAQTNSISRGVESNHLTQVLLSKIQKQDCVDRLQHSLGFDIL